MFLDRFQSTRLSRASTYRLFIHGLFLLYFNPQGSREPRPVAGLTGGCTVVISIHKALASLDRKCGCVASCVGANFNPQGSREPRQLNIGDANGFGLISIHKALASLDVPAIPFRNLAVFQSTRLSRASTVEPSVSIKRGPGFQSTRLSRASTYQQVRHILIFQISIHKALASLDLHLAFLPSC